MMTDEEKEYAGMSCEQRIAWLRKRYPDAYAWADEQPCMSYDFVSVPIESLDELVRNRC